MRRIVLDTDLAMGALGSDVDDGFALAMAVADPDVSLELITTVDGNTDVDTATRLSTELLHRVGATVPVHRGADRPLSAGAAPNDAVTAMIEKVLTSPAEVTLVAIGPLTNIALALRTEPSLAEALEELVIMGGSFFETEPRAEFNARSDPAAAAYVLDSGLTSRWVGLNVTEQVRLSRRRAEELAASEAEFTAFAGRQALPWIDQVRGPGEASCALHDPLAVAAVTRPELMTWRPAAVRVSSTGSMRVDPDGPVNAAVAAAVDADGFLTYFEDLLDRL